MTTSTAKNLAALQKHDLKKWHVSLWLVKHKLDVNKKASYSVLRVDIDKKLNDKLKRAVISRVNKPGYKLAEYDFSTADQDSQIFTIDVPDTDFSKIQAEIEKGLQNKKVDKYEDILNSWAYVIKLESDGNVLYGVRKIHKFTQLTKMQSHSYFLFEDKKLVDLDETKILSLDTNLDFFSYSGTIFILNKKEFESVMNFRVGMEKNRDAVLKEFATLKIFSDIEPIRKSIGTNMHFLRKISAIQKSGYYKNPQYIKDLIKVNQDKGWGLTVKDGVIIVTEANVDLVLTLLNNGRLESPINHEIFDASVKKKVG